MTNQLDTSSQNQTKLGSKENPIFVETQEQFDNLRNLSYINFYCHCDTCSKKDRLVSAQVRNERRSTQRRLFCKSCNKKETHIEKHGKLIDGIVFVEKPSDIDMLRRQQKIQFYCHCPTCKTPHEIVYAIIQNERREHIKKLYCINCNREETLIKRYGTINVFDVKEISDKRKQTCLKKYGTEHVFQSSEIREKIKQTNIQRYGAEYANSSEEIKEKTKKTLMDKYGVEYTFQSKEIQEKCKETMKERYGAAYTYQSKELLQKCKDTVLKTYGVEYTAQSEEIRQKTKKTMVERYGVELALQNKELLKKAHDTIQERYGVEHALQNKDIQNKRQQTSIEHYNVPIPTKSPIIKDKIKRTCLEKYGVDSYSKTTEFKQKFRQSIFDKYGTYHVPSNRYVYNGLSFDSSWELAFYVWHVDHNVSIIREPEPIEYIFNDEVHYYFPDFQVADKFYEIKGDQFFKDDGTMCNPYDHSLDAIFEAKHQCGLMNGVTFLKSNDISSYLQYMQEHYGIEWEKTFKLV